MKPLLSLCMIVKNEAASLSPCLMSVKPYVDELIVVDTGSTDNSIEIAQSLDAQIYPFEWCNNFAAARNYSLTKASGEWILVLDADEELKVKDHSWKTLLEGDPTTLAYAIPLRDAVSQETAMEPLRLFRHHADLKFEGRYHEHIYFQGTVLSSNHPFVKTLPNIEIIHYGYSETAIAQKSPLRIPILEKIRQDEGLDLMLLWTLSGMYECVGNSEDAQGCYAEALDRLSPNLLTNTMPQDIRAVRSWLYSLGVRSLQAEDLETARIIAQQGAEWFPDFPPLHYLNGLLLRMLGFGRGAIPYFELCLEAQRTSHYFKGEPFDQALLSTYPAFDIGTMYLELNQVQKAIAAFELALSFDPTHKPAQIQLDKAKILAHSSNSSK
jgi:tetratricopeptide (TPR) repeat protein